MAPKTFARRVEALREERGWSQNQLATRAGMRAADLSRILTGSRNLLSHHVVRLAAALGVTVDDLIARTGVEVDLSESVPNDVIRTSDEARENVEQALEAHRAMVADVVAELEAAQGTLGEVGAKDAAAKVGKLAVQLGKHVKERAGGKAKAQAGKGSAAKAKSKR